LFERTRVNAESPFQFRRGRMEDSALRYRRALNDVRTAADRWTDDDGKKRQDPSLSHAVHRLVEFLDAHAQARQRENLGAIEADIHVLEGALAHVRRGRWQPTPADPFRW
jgi:hypothetical protein